MRRRSRTRMKSKSYIRPILILIALILVCSFMLPSTSSKYVKTVTQTITLNISEPTYQVVFNANTGTGSMNPQDFVYSVAQNLTANSFTKVGYTFSSWNTQPDGSGTSYSNSQSVDKLSTVNGGVINLYAQWTPITYQVHFDANTGTGTMSNQTFTYDQAQNLSTNTFTKTLYGFSGWNTEANGSGTSYTDEAQVLNLASTSGATVTLYAQWTETLVDYTITYNLDGGTLQNPINTYNRLTPTFTIPTPTKAGYTFTGWTKGTSPQIYNPYTVTQGSTGNIELTAVWDRIYHTVSFNANGGNGTMSSQSVGEGDSITPTCTFTRNNYIFAGWATSANGNVEYLDGESIIVNNDMTLYAKWAARRTITFNRNQSRNDNTTTTQVVGNGVPTHLNSVTWTRNGYRFAGWATSRNGSVVYQDGDVITVTNNTTLYAVWIQQYSITFNANGGTGTMETIYVDAGGSVTLPLNTFTNGNRTFDSWNTMRYSFLIIFGTSYDDGDTITNINSNITLYAQWN